MFCLTKVFELFNINKSISNLCLPKIENRVSMRKIRKIVYLLILLTVSSCAVSKAEKYLKEGETVQKSFKETIPFEIKNGFIILKVKINHKNYNFLLDTGASNIISKELATELNMKVLGSESIYDIYNVEQKTDYTRIDNIQIGNIDFTQTITAITDFNSIPTWACMKVDGFIGSNLMQHAIWDFDFETNTITITNDESKLNLPKDIIENKLFIGYAGIPSIATKINGKKVWNFTVDFGFNGGINIPFSEFEKQIKNGKISEYIKSKTQGGIGIYGRKDEIKESFLSRIDIINFGNTTLENKIVTSEKHLAKLYGLGFFKDYRVILNWKSKKIKLISKKTRPDLNYIDYGFSYSYIDNGLFISTLFDKTKASDYLQIGDKIISLNGDDYSVVSDEKYCSIMEKGILGKYNKQIEIKILRNNKELIFKLEKEILLN